MYSTLAYQQILLPDRYHTGRNRKIDSVVIHYAAAVVNEAQAVVDYWRTKDYTGANYVIDVYGRITSVVPEEYRAYTTGTYFLPYKDDIDDHAITIECSCDNNESYTVSGRTIEALCQLLADIGFRFGIYWKYTGDKNGNIHAHRWYQATPCPGDYLYGKFDIIVDIANFYLFKKEEYHMIDAFKEIQQVVEKHTVPVYNTLSDFPEWARPEMVWLVNNGYLKGNEAGLQISNDMLRLLVIMIRLYAGGKYEDTENQTDRS